MELAPMKLTVARATAALTALMVGAAAFLLPSTAAVAATGPEKARLEAAVSYAHSKGVRAAIGVLDTHTGSYVGAGDDTSLYPTASVVKVLIATELLASGQMTRGTANLAFSMITRSDDDAATALWPVAGGSDLMHRIESRYHLNFLGAPNVHPGLWGGTRITARGMAYLYAAIKRDPVVYPWLHNAMAHAQRIADGGDMQFFGIPSATKGFAIKQGWGQVNSTNDDDVVVFNSTGYVNDDRYAVVMLTEGKAWMWGPSPGTGPEADVLDAEADEIMPGGVIDAEAHAPYGRLDSHSTSNNRVTVLGWAVDPDAKRSKVTVQVTEAKRTVWQGSTSVPRADITRTFRAPGSHGFSASFAATPGRHSYCVVLHNIGPGVNAAPKCRVVVVPASAG